MTAAKRVAILSFAHYHANFWAEAFIEDPTIELAAIWDDDAARGREAAGRFAVPFVADLNAAIAAVDAVAVCSETSRHPDLVVTAAAAGRAVLCEKPLARNIAEAARMAEAVATSGSLFMQSFPKRLDPVSHRLKAIVDNGSLGRIHQVRIRHGHFYGLTPEFKERWYVRQALAGGGALLDEGVHGADLLCWLFGLPESCIATVSSAILGLEVEESGTALFHYPDGMTAELTASFLYAAADASIEIYGSTGTVIVAGVDLASRDLTESGFLKVSVECQGQRSWHVEDVVPQFKRGRFHHQNAFAFARCLRTGERPPATLADGRNALALIEAAYAAAASGKRVPVGHP
jgi:predicted dehydrogenase